MDHGSRTKRRGVWLSLAALVAAMLATPSARAEWGVPKVGLSLGADITTAYFFRGILQERNGFIFQPYAEVDIPFWQSAEDAVDPISRASFFFGSWNSIHSRATLASPSSEWGNFYEADLYAGMKFTVLKTIEFKPYYIAYKYPGGAFNTVQEVDLGFSLNDAQWLDKWALNPTALVAWEFKNTALGLNEGTYAEVGIRPSYTIYDDEEYPVSLALPNLIGMSINDYFESPSGNDESFGYWRTGLIFSVPLAFMSGDYGNWAVNAGAYAYVFNSNLRNINFGDSPWIVGTWGITYSY
jgi:hypothetical protein